jgi:hypothetical protein
MTDDPDDLEPEVPADSSPRDRALVPPDPFRRYLAEAGKYPPLNREEEQELARRYRDTGDREALLHLTEVRVPEDFVPRICSGQKLRAEQLPVLAALAEGQKARIESPDGRVLAVAEMRGGTLHYLRVLATRS